MRYFLLFLLLTTSANAAEFNVLKDTPERFAVLMAGYTYGDDAKKFDDLFRNNKAKQKILFLHGKGGDYTASTVIGYGVRQYGVTTIIPIWGRCVSACSLIFVAGWDKEKGSPSRYKHVKSLLGVHHPLNMRTGKKSSQSFMTRSYKPYLEDMNAGDLFYKRTAETSPHKLYFIKNSELVAMGDYQILNY